MNVVSPLLQQGDLLGHYRIERCLGRGGMGEVYLACDENGGVPVAIKLLLPEIMIRDPAFVERFQEEGRLACRISHPNVVGVIDARHDVDAGFCYLVMEYVDGGSLQELLDRGGRLDWEWALTVALKVSRALELAADLGIVHRDIKPDNIMLTESGEIKLADLGIARRITAAGDGDGRKVMVGTPGYASPEQCIDPGRVDARSDIYSLGATIYEALTGRIAYQGDTPLETISRVLHDPVPDPRIENPEIPVPVAELVMRMMAKEQSARPRSAAELSAEIENLLSSVGGQRGPDWTVAGVRRLFLELTETAGARLFSRPCDRRSAKIAAGIGAAFLIALFVPLPKPPQFHCGEDPNPAILREAPAAIEAARARNAALSDEIREAESRLNVTPGQAFLDALLVRYDEDQLRRWFAAGVRPVAGELSRDWVENRAGMAALPSYRFATVAGRLLDRYGFALSDGDMTRLLRYAVTGNSVERGFARNALNVLFASECNRAVLTMPFHDVARFTVEIPAEKEALRAERLRDFDLLLKLLRERGFSPDKSNRTPAELIENVPELAPFREMLGRL